MLPNAPSPLSCGLTGQHHFPLLFDNELTCEPAFSLSKVNLWLISSATDDSGRGFLALDHDYFSLDESQSWVWSWSDQEVFSESGNKLPSSSICMASGFLRWQHAHAENQLT